jgi:tRNA(Ile)-lysidine synthase
MDARRVAVAYSGGRDSTALLHATRAAAGPLGVEVVALHVHHGLHADADAWLAHCRRVCRRWKVDFTATRLADAPARGDSIEAWASDRRYAALAELARGQGASLVLLAHHRRDQAETFLLQALRGGGLAGLASMPPLREQGGIVWARPWLAQPREAIEGYVRRHRLSFVDDGSNDDPRHARNRLRREVWPALLAAFPQADTALAATANHAAQAREVLDALADRDLPDEALAVARWLALEPARRRNALRRWLGRHGVLSASLVERLLRELPSTRDAQWPADAVHELRLYRGTLRVEPRVAASPGEAGVLTIDRAGDYVLPAWGGCLRVRRVRRDGVAPSALLQLRVVERRGGERFQLAQRSIPRSLKKQFQARGIGAWQRRGPLLYSGERLLYVPGLGIDARLKAGDGEPQFSLRWVDAGRR